MTSYVLVVDGPGAAADQQHQNRGAQEEQDSKMEVMDPTHQERTAGRVNAAAGTEPELGDHSAEAHGQASYQAPERPLQVKTEGVRVIQQGDLSAFSPFR